MGRVRIVRFLDGVGRSHGSVSQPAAPALPSCSLSECLPMEDTSLQMVSAFLPEHQLTIDELQTCSLGLGVS